MKRAACTALVAGTVLAGACNSNPSSRRTGCAASQQTVVFYVLDGASDVATVRSELERDRSLASVRFFDHDAAFARVKRLWLYRDHPELLRDVRPEDLPESFTATVRAGTPVRDIVARYERFPGVTNVIPDRPVTRCGS
jgi:hypothetical protein